MGSNNLVLWDSTINYTTKLASGIFTSIAGREGVVCKFIGTGTLWIQTRNPINMISPSK